MEGSRTAIWIAWGLALLGGIAVLVAAFLVGRVDLAAACTPGSACLTALSPATSVLTFGGTALAIVGGSVATALTVRRSWHDEGDRDRGGDLGRQPTT